MDDKELSKKTQLRCKKLYDVGLEMFLKNGYKKTSLNDIVKKAGGSLATIYKHFGNKEEFFEAVVFQGIEEFYTNFEQKLKLNKDLNLEQFLYQFGSLYSDVIESKKSIGIGKILYQESHLDNGMMATKFQKRVDDMMFKIFKDFFEKKSLKKELSDSDLAIMVERFCLLIKEPEFYQTVVMNKKFKRTQEEKNKKVHDVVHFFLYGFRKIPLSEKGKINE